ncbi:hypothetical protein AMTRI_Chr01g134660 [Amborella trichopoda]
MKRIGMGLFYLSLDYKIRYACDANFAASEGFGSRMLDWKDYFDHHSLPEFRRSPNNWPDFPDDYRLSRRILLSHLVRRDVALRYSDQMRLLVQKLLKIISESLGLPSAYIQEAIELTLGLQAHSYMGAITLLVQDDVGGLQVLNDVDWITVEPLPDAIVVNLSDQTEWLIFNDWGVSRKLFRPMGIKWYYLGPLANYALSWAQADLAQPDHFLPSFSLCHLFFRTYCYSW